MEKNVLFVSIILSYLKINLILLFLTLFLSEISLVNMTEQKSEINLIIEGEGNQYFLNETFYLEPSEVIVNDVQNDSCKINCFFKKDLNNVTIKFDRLINTTENMFKGLKNIIEIDLSNFHTSKVTSMVSMFESCLNLSKINFGYINTSLVKDMTCLFHECKKLASVDVSKFDTSSVTSFKYLFRFCVSLTSIDLSNFNTQNVEDIYDIFSSCNSLTSVDLSNFDTSKVTNMRGLFYKCNKLRHLDLRNFNTSLVTNFHGMFSNANSLIFINIFSFIIQNGSNVEIIFNPTPPDIKICINDTETQKILNFTGKKIDCSDICFEDNIKIDLKQNLCLKHCNEGVNKYEYNNYCIETCPNSTYVSNNNKYLCLDKTIEDNYYYNKNNNI